MASKKGKKAAVATEEPVVENGAEIHMNGMTNGSQGDKLEGAKKGRGRPKKEDEGKKAAPTAEVGKKAAPTVAVEKKAAPATKPVADAEKTKSRQAGKSKAPPAEEVVSEDAAQEEVAESSPPQSKKGKGRGRAPAPKTDKTEKVDKIEKVEKTEKSEKMGKAVVELEDAAHVTSNGTKAAATKGRGRPPKKAV